MDVVQYLLEHFGGSPPVVAVDCEVGAHEHCREKIATPFEGYERRCLCSCHEAE